MTPFERNAAKGDSVRPISKIISLIKVRWKLRMEFFRWFCESELQPSLSAFIHSAPLPLNWAPPQLASFSPSLSRVQFDTYLFLYLWRSRGGDPILQRQYSILSRSSFSPHSQTFFSHHDKEPRYCLNICQYCVFRRQITAQTLQISLAHFKTPFKMRTADLTTRPSVPPLPKIGQKLEKWSFMVILQAR